jgi:hypothetical protein
MRGISRTGRTLRNWVCFAQWAPDASRAAPNWLCLYGRLAPPIGSVWRGKAPPRANWVRLYNRCRMGTLERWNDGCFAGQLLEIGFVCTACHALRPSVPVLPGTAGELALFVHSTPRSVRRDKLASFVPRSSNRLLPTDYRLLALFDTATACVQPRSKGPPKALPMRVHTYLPQAAALYYRRLGTPVCYAKIQTQTEISRRDAGTQSWKRVRSCLSLRLRVSARVGFGCGRRPLQDLCVSVGNRPLCDGWRRLALPWP